MPILFQSKGGYNHGKRDANRRHGGQMNSKIKYIDIKKQIVLQKVVSHDVV